MKLAAPLPLCLSIMAIAGCLAAAPGGTAPQPAVIQQPAAPALPAALPVRPAAPPASSVPPAVRPTAEPLEPVAIPTGAGILPRGGGGGGPAGPPGVTIAANLGTPLLRTANATLTVATGADARLVEVDGTNLYYIDGGGGAFGTTGTALKAQPLAGGPAATLATDAVVAFCRVGTTLYYATATTIGQVATTGGATAVVLPGQTAIRALAADAVNVYYLESGALKRFPIAGGGVTTLADGFADPSGLVIDGTNAYVTDRGSGNNGTVKKVPLAGGGAVALATNQPAPAAVTVDGTSVYFANAPIGDGGDLRKVPIAGGAVTLLATGLKASLPRLAVDATHLYYLEGNTGTATATAGSVRRVPLAGGEPFLMAVQLNRPVGLALDGTTVYFSLPTAVSALQKVAK